MTGKLEGVRSVTKVCGLAPFLIYSNIVVNICGQVNMHKPWIVDFIGRQHADGSKLKLHLERNPQGKKKKHLIKKPPGSHQGNRL